MSQKIEKDALAVLEQLGTKARMLRRILSQQEVDTFAAVDAIKAIQNQLNVVNDAQQLLQQVSADMSARSILAQTEFWDSFRDACNKRSWTIFGTTDRRLVEQGVFMQLSFGKVRVEELSLETRPRVESVTAAFAPHIDEIRSWLQRQDQFTEALEHAYESVSGDREKSLEAVYRATFLHIQRQAFWKALRISHMTGLTRPVFRACLSAVISSGGRTPKGRTLRFGTSLLGKDTWELFSPGEQRVVQVGRIALD